MTTTQTQNYSAEVAQTIRSQIGVMSLMTLGAHDLRQGTDASGNPGLTFAAIILPMEADGTRASEPVEMQVQVTLNGVDLYDVLVAYLSDGVKTHYEADDVDCGSLPRLMLALDYDGDTVLNPRYV